MRIREQVSRYSGAVTVVAIAATAIAVAIAARSTGSVSQTGAPDLTEYFFVDPDTGQLSQRPSPISPAVENGKEIFRAYVYSCSSCSDASSRFVGHMEKLSPDRQAKEAQMRSSLRPGDELPPVARAELRTMGGQYISAPSPVEWIAPTDPGAEKILTASRAKCPGLSLPCTPGQ